MTAGPDEIRGPAPNQKIAFHDALTQTGCAGPRDRPVLPSLRFAPTPPSVAAPPMGKLSSASYAAASVAAAALEARYASPLRSMAQITRAVLFATAMATTFA